MDDKTEKKEDFQVASEASINGAIESSKLLSIDNRRLLNMALALILALAIIYLVSSYVSRNIRIYKGGPVVETRYNPFETIDIEARAAIVFDIKQGKVLFEKNADEELPLASLTKVMTAVTALEYLPTHSVVNIDRKFIKQEGDNGLLGDEKWETKDLINFSLLVSSNDGIAAVAAAATATGASTNGTELNFTEKMNEKAVKIGMLNSRFYNETGLDLGNERAGAYGSARDMAKLFSYAIKEFPEIFDATRHEKLTFKSLNNVYHNASNTNKSVNHIPGILTSKTGYTEMAGGNLAIVFDPGLANPIAVVVLGSGTEGRFQDVALLVNTTFDYLASR